MVTQSRKIKKHSRNKIKWRSGVDVKRRTRDHDQIYDDMKAADAASARGDTPKPKFDPALPGGGQHYCVSCARHFVSATVLEQHKRSKPHKRQLRNLTRDRPYTHAEAEAAAGMAPADTGKPKQQFYERAENSELLRTEAREKVTSVARLVPEADMEG